jgi:hypothetical protein
MPSPIATGTERRKGTALVDGLRLLAAPANNDLDAQRATRRAARFRFRLSAALVGRH